eukprot:Pompholyxophrys_punicea_v1_NODE_711_length_1410_cov_6.816974.p1 type:complete len:108 gc:universal NODE_711_length_1410_cov_6.816974:1061-738(-)
MAIMLGINAANSNQFCLWCGCKKEDIEDTKKAWKTTRNLTSCHIGKDGQQKPPLLTSIDFEDVGIDRLHLFLRISDVLLKALVDDAISLANTPSAEKTLLERLIFTH